VVPEGALGDGARLQALHWNPSLVASEKQENKLLLSPLVLFRLTHCMLLRPVRLFRPLLAARSMSATPPVPAKSSRQSTKSSRTPPESVLVLPQHAELQALTDGEQVELVDTHTHVLSTFHACSFPLFSPSSFVRSPIFPPIDVEKYPRGQHQNVKDFVKATLPNMTSVVDVWCEAPMRENWKETVETLSELKEEDPSSLNYHFVVGASPDYLYRSSTMLTKLFFPFASLPLRLSSERGERLQRRPRVPVRRRPSPPALRGVG
jgi:hypothetical protein